MLNDSVRMRDILTELSGTHWVAVKFYASKPRGVKLSVPAPFCAAAAEALTEASLMKVSSIPCGGARYAFSVPGAKAPVMRDFVPARLNKLIEPLSAAMRAPRLPFSPAYVGFNQLGGADLYLSFMLNESANELAQAWGQLTGKRLDCRFTGVMSFCSEGAAAAIDRKRPAFSLGCSRSIKAAGLQGQVCVCLHERNAARLARAWLAAPAGSRA